MAFYCAANVCVPQRNERWLNSVSSLHGMYEGVALCVSHSSARSLRTLSESRMSIFPRFAAALNGWAPTCDVRWCNSIIDNLHALLSGNSIRTTPLFRTFISLPKLTSSAMCIVRFPIIVPKGSLFISTEYHNHELIVRGSELNVRI